MIVTLVPQAGHSTKHFRVLISSDLEFTLLYFHKRFQNPNYMYSRATYTLPYVYFVRKPCFLPLTAESASGALPVNTHRNSKVRSESDHSLL